MPWILWSETHFYCVQLWNELLLGWQLLMIMLVVDIFVLFIFGVFIGNLNMWRLWSLLWIWKVWNLSLGLFMYDVHHLWEKGSKNLILWWASFEKAPCLVSETKYDERFSRYQQPSSQTGLASRLIHSTKNLLLSIYMARLSMGEKIYLQRPLAANNLDMQVVSAIRGFCIPRLVLPTLLSGT
jgi:hypothetical protein